MSLIVGPYYQGDPTVKPPCWGPAVDVSAVIAERLENLCGAPKPEIALSSWGPGNQINYGTVPAIFANTSAGFERNTLQYNGSSSRIVATDSRFSNTVWTVLQRVRSDVSVGTTVKQTINNLSGIGTEGAFSFSWGHPATAFRQAWAFRGTDDNWYSVKYNTTLIADTDYIIAATHDGSTLRIYLDGVLDNSNTLNKTPKTGVGRIVIGGTYSYSETSYQGFFDGSIGETLVFNGVAMSGPQIADLTDSFSGIWQPPTFRTYFLPQEAGDSPIIVTKASIVISGKAAKASQGVAPGKDSIALAPASVKVSESIIPTTEAIGITGGTVTISANSVLSPAADSITITGVTGLVNDTVSPGTDNIAISGKAAKASESISPSKDSVTISGGTVTVTVGEVVTITAASITLDGKPLTVHDTITPDKGSIVISGGVVRETGQAVSGILNIGNHKQKISFSNGVLRIG